jgi:hypothetical protein
LKNLLQQLASVIGISGIVTIILRRHSFIEIIDKAAEKINVAKDLLYTGINHVEASYDKFNFKDEIRLCNSAMDIYVIYSSTWLKMYLKDLVKYAKEKEAHMRFCFLNPESPSVKVLEKKFIAGCEGKEGYLKNKIIDSVEFIEKNFFKDDGIKSLIEIFYQDYVPQHCIYRFDSKLVVIPYQISPGRSSCPLFGFQDTGNKEDLFHKYLADFERLINNFASLHKSNR